VAFAKVLTIYHTSVLPHLHHSPLFPFLHNPRVVSTAFAPYKPSYTFSSHPPPSTGTKSLDRTCFAHQLSDFVKEKNDIFVCLFKIAMQGVSL
jgi:hypothetical protein